MDVDLVIKIQKIARGYITKKRYNKSKEQLESMDDFENTVNHFVKLNKISILNEAKDKIRRNYPGIVFRGEKIFKNTCIITVVNTASTRTCPISMRVHNSNHIYFTLNYTTRKLSLKCYKCKDGYKDITDSINTFDEIKDHVTQTEKTSKRKGDATTGRLRVPSMRDVEKITFCTETMKMSQDDIFEMYTELKFTWVPAKKNQKRPAFSGWTEKKFEDNQPINFTHNNVAIVTGVLSDLVVIDCDIKEGGVEYFECICSRNKYNYSNATLCARTPSGGLHIYYKYDTILSKNHGRLTDDEGTIIGIDIRSNHGVVIAPPSRFEQGSYEFICCKKPTIIPDFLRSIFTNNLSL